MLYLTRICIFVLQLFERQVEEDGILATREWAPCRSPPPEGASDSDNDDNIPIPRVKPLGKDSDYSSSSENSDDDELDCYILDPLDPTPISWASATVPAKASGSRKRASESEEEPPQPPKKVKRVAKRPASRLKAMPTSDG